MALGANQAVAAEKTVDAVGKGSFANAAFILHCSPRAKDERKTPKQAADSV